MTDVIEEDFSPMVSLCDYHSNFFQKKGEQFQNERRLHVILLLLCNLSVCG